MTQRRRGCFSTFSRIWTILFFVVLIGMTSVNVFFSNIFGETCGFIHPMIFEVNVNMIEADGLMLSNVRAIPAQNNPDLQALEAEGIFRTPDNFPLDTVLRVYDATADSLLAINDDANSFTFTSELPEFSVEQNQTIIIEVGTFLEGSEGRYTLSVQDIGESTNITAEDLTPEPFPFEPIAGGVLDSAQLMEGVTVSGEIFRDQRVRYTLDVVGGRSYFIDLDGVLGFSDLPRTTSTTWSSCLQFYGFVSDSGFNINNNGFFYFLNDGLANRITDSCSVDGDFSQVFDCVEARVDVSPTGRIIFFVILAVLVVSIPIFVVDTLGGQREVTWYIFLVLVILQATTSAMLFLHLGNVSGIESLSEFGYGIFGGITTGAALVFIERVANRADDT